MAKVYNPKVNFGDRIMVLHMDGESSVPMGTNGTVKKIVKDPFDDGEIIEVSWDNGSNLSLVSSVDSWTFAKKPKITESSSGDAQFDSYGRNMDIVKLFDWRYLKNYLLKIRESGIVNMLGASPLLYAGREHIDRYYGENPPNQEAFDEVLDMADTAKNKMIQGTVKWLQSQNKEVSVENANRYISKLASKILDLYMNFI